MGHLPTAQGLCGELNLETTLQSDLYDLRSRGKLVNYFRNYWNNKCHPHVQHHLCRCESSSHHGSPGSLAKLPQGKKTVTQAPSR